MVVKRENRLKNYRKAGDSLLRRLDAVIAHYGEANEGNAFRLRQSMN